MKVEHMDEQDEHGQMWDALLGLARAYGLIGSTDPSSYTEVMLCVDVMKKRLMVARQQKEQNVDRAADLLAADMVALRAEMKKPMEALGQVHKMVIDGVADGSSKAKDRLARVCLWALLGDDDYLTDAADRLALLGPTPGASGPASGAQQPS